MNPLTLTKKNRVYEKTNEAVTGQKKFQVFQTQHSILLKTSPKQVAQCCAKSSSIVSGCHD